MTQNVHCELGYWRYLATLVHYWLAVLPCAERAVIHAERLAELDSDLSLLGVGP